MLPGDSRRQPWANFIETGPGVRFRFDPMPKSVTFTVNAVRGRYTVREGLTLAPTYYDVRAGMWYAFSH